MRALKAKLSSKNQVVIPKQARQSLGLEAGDSILLIVKDGMAVLIKEPDSYVDALGGSLKGTYDDDYLKRERESWDGR